jgi:hypothetical protein
MSHMATRLASPHRHRSHHVPAFQDLDNSRGNRSNNDSHGRLARGGASSIPRVKRLFTREVFIQNSILLRTSEYHVPYHRDASLGGDLPIVET